MRSVILALALALPLAAADATPSTPSEPAKAGWLGIGIDEVDDALTYQLGLENDLGVLVTRVAPGSPAEKMGIKTWDIIVGLADQPVYTPRGLTEAVRAQHAGATVQVSVRRGLAVQKLSGILGEAPPQPVMRPGVPSEMPDRPHGQRREHPRAGKVEGPDGQVMEWSVEEPETKPGPPF